jgi:NADPH:quinone reductase
VNPHDAKVRDVGLFVNFAGLPYVLGSDVVGTVAGVHASVTKFKIGDRVAGEANLTSPGTPQGSLQQYAVLSAHTAFRIPDRITNDQAATIPTNAMTSFAALFHSSGFGWNPSAERGLPSYEDKCLVVVGGGASTGRYAIQLAKMVGVGKIITIASLQNEEELKSLGAAHVVSRQLTDEEVERQVREITGDDVQWVFDTVSSGPRVQLSLDMLSYRKKGICVTLRAGSEDREKLKGKNYELRHILGISELLGETGSTFFEHLPSWLEEGKLVPMKNWALINGLDADMVNAALDSYAKEERVGQTHVHIGI